MAFCDNPKCRFKDLHAPICAHETIVVKSHNYNDLWTEKLIKRRFCDDCVELVEKAEKRLEYLRRTYPVIYQGYLIDHGDNLLLHFVQSEWFAREHANKKSPF